MQDVKKFEAEMQDCKRSPGSRKMVIFIDILHYIPECKLKWIKVADSTESSLGCANTLQDLLSSYQFLCRPPTTTMGNLWGAPPQFCIAGEILINVLVKAKLWRLQASSSANWRSIAGPATLFQNLNFQGKVCSNALASESVVVSSRKNIVLL